MTKPTILILIIVYLASVLVVGIFGIQIMSFNNINYIDSISLTNDNDHIEFSADRSLLVIKENTKGEDAIEYKSYNLIIWQSSAGMTLKITPIVVAVDPTLDATNKELEVSILCDEGFENCITYNNGIFTINKQGCATITYRSKDNSNKKMVIEFYIL